MTPKEKAMEKERKKFMQFKGKDILYYNEDELSKIFCDNIAKCNGEQPTESDTTGCTGCDAQEDFLDYVYSIHMLDEVSSFTNNEFISLKDCKELLKAKAKEIFKEIEEHKIRIEDAKKYLNIKQKYLCEKNGN